MSNDSDASLKQAFEEFEQHLREKREMECTLLFSPDADAPDAPMVYSIGELVRTYRHELTWCALGVVVVLLYATSWLRM